MMILKCAALLVLNGRWSYLSAHTTEFIGSCIFKSIVCSRVEGALTKPNASVIEPKKCVTFVASLRICYWCIQCAHKLQ